MGQQSGRHRQERLHRHRAPALPALFASRGRTALFASRGRTALSVTALSATIVAGVGAAGVAASAAPNVVSNPIAQTVVSNPVAHVTASHPYVEAPIVAPPGDEAPGKQFPRSAVAGSGDGGRLGLGDRLGLGNRLGEESAAPAGVAVRLKKRPAVTAKAAIARSATSSAAAWVHPIPAAGVTSCFGPRWGRLHAGVDLAAAFGTTIVAAGAGVVVTAGPDGGYGNAVLIQHNNGYLTHYGHMSEVLVVAGQTVDAGERIGLEGSTGHSTGPHLHFEVHAGHYKNPIEPTAWMHAQGVEISGCAG